MSTIRLSKVLKELNIGLDRAIETLANKGHEVENNRNTKISDEQYQILLSEFEQDRSRKEKSEQVNQLVREEKEIMRQEKEKETVKLKEKVDPPAETPVVEKQPEPTPEPVKEEEQPVVAEKESPKAEEENTNAPEAEAPQLIKGKADKPRGLKVISKIDLTPKKKEEKKQEVVKEEEAETPAIEEAVVPTAETPAEEPVAETPEPAQPTVEEEKPVEEPAAEKPVEEEKPAAKEASSDRIETKYIKLDGPKFTGQKIELPAERPKKKAADKAKEKEDNKRKRKRIKKVPEKFEKPAGPGGDKRGKPTSNTDKRKKVEKAELTDEEIQKQIKETLEKLTSGKKSKGAKIRRQKRADRQEREELEGLQREEESKILKVTEFVTATELANMMSVPVTQVISSLMSLGVMVTMNQRLDAEMLSLVAEEFGFEAQFVDQEVTETFQIEEDAAEDLQHRAPIVTVMGHVDHGKTSLLDYIRKANVIAGEAGGITQHIGAYTVQLENGSHITFLDTPGHEAFTAMRARGAQVTDIAIIVVAADDAVMPQTKEAISHAQAANVPIVFAINKVDRPTANPEKIKEQLAGLNLLVEDWGGKIQSQDISAKTGMGVKELLEKVLLEAELLDLKANPDRNAMGTVIEASLDKGRGYVTTILVENGTLRVGDYVLAGMFSGKVKAMLDERGHRIKEAGPSTPLTLLGLDGAPQAGDRFIVMNDEREAKQMAAKRLQLQREQSVRSQKKMTLEEIGRRLAIGDFKELNIVLKGDVDGSIEALADSLQKLSTEEIAVNIIHKGVGQITEGDVLLASASDAIIVGFQVRPSANARKIAERESVEIRLYSIIYDAINQIRDAMEGMLSPDFEEEITGAAEIRETFKISKVGTIAGCMVTDGTISRNSKVRLIRDGVVIYTGDLGSLKRYKDDVKDVQKGYECGLNIANYNDIKVGDVVEAFKQVEVKKTL
jgi:translation initiation factor IF-2